MKTIEQVREFVLMKTTSEMIRFAKSTVPEKAIFQKGVEFGNEILDFIDSEEN